MFNPFARFVPELVHVFRGKGDRYIVSQTLAASINTGIPGKDRLLFSQYRDRGHAQTHLNAIGADKYAAIVDLEGKQHRDRVMEVLGTDSPYLVFSNLLTDKELVEETATKLYADRLHRYIASNTTWRIPSGTHLRPDIRCAFGKLFIVLKFRSQQIRLKFEDLDNQYPV